MCARVAWPTLLRHSAAAQGAATQAAYRRAGWLLVLPPAALPPGAGRHTAAAARPVAEQRQGQKLSPLAAALHGALGPRWAERLVLLWPWRAAAGGAGGGGGGWPLAAEAGWLGVAPLRLAAALRVQDSLRAKVGVGRGWGRVVRG